MAVRLFVVLQFECFGHITTVNQQFINTLYRNFGNKQSYTYRYIYMDNIYIHTYRTRDCSGKKKKKNIIILNR